MVAVWIMGALAVYGFCALIIQFRTWLYLPQPKSTVHCYLYTYNSQANIEWVVRCLFMRAHAEGRNIYFHVLDDGSNDDTLAIVERLSRRNIWIERVDATKVGHLHIAKPVSSVEPISETSVQPLVIDLRKGKYACEWSTT